jgi:hypothetical protein
MVMATVFDHRHTSSATTIGFRLWHAPAAFHFTLDTLPLDVSEARTDTQPYYNYTVGHGVSIWAA